MGSKKQRFSADFKGELTELELIWDLKLIAFGGCSLQKHVGLSDFVETLSLCSVQSWLVKTWQVFLLTSGDSSDFIPDSPGTVCW
jgi:hypothetical protein